MSRENIELVSRAHEAMTRHEVHTFLTLVDAHVELISPIAEWHGKTYHGHDGVRRWFESLACTFVRFGADIRELQELDEEHLMIKVRVHGLLGEAEVAEDMYEVVRVRGGKATRWAFFRTEEQAMEAVAAAEDG